MRLIVLLGVITTLLAGCSSTTVNQEWKDPGYTGPGIRSALVVGFPMNSPIGHECTDEFVTQLGEKGIPATRGYNVLPAIVPKQMALDKTRELGLDGLLICRFLERRSQLDVYPRDTYGSMLVGPDVELWPPNEYVENKYDVFGTMLYDAASGKTIWSAISDTYAGKSEKKILRSYVKTMVKSLEDQKVIKPTKK